MKSEGQLGADQSEGGALGSTQLASVELAEERQAAPSSSPPVSEAEPSRTSGELIGSVVAGRYRISRLLGEGGMGAVYFAEHVHMRKPFAVKVLHRDLTAVTEVVARFEREAIAAGLIDHANVAKATDFGRLADGSFFLVLEYVDGLSLADTLDEEKVFSEEKTLAVTRQIADTLVAAHGAGIVHRDLKPDNVMLTERGYPFPSVKVLDFGIAKLDTGSAGPALTRLGTVFGTPQYMAPEQAAGQVVDSRADLYAVGIMMYEMLSGKVPFDGEEIGSVLAKQITMAPEPLSEGIDPELRALVSGLLEKSAEQRIQTAESLIFRIDSILARLASRPGSELRVSLPFLSSQPLAASLTPPPVSVQLRPEVSAPAALGLAGRLRALPGVHVPFVALAFGGLSAFVLGIFLSGMFFMLTAGDPLPEEGEFTQEATQAPAEEEPARPDPQLTLLLASAATGDPAALKSLEERPEQSRSAVEWAALGQGRSAAGRVQAGLEAYDQALKLDPSLAKDPVLLGHVRAAANRADTGNLALSIAERHLGSAGADLLYDVWVATKAKNEQTQLAKTLLESPQMQAKHSPALKAVLALREAKTCQDYHALLPEVTLSGDTRSVRVLQKLTVKRGCGIAKLRDCYSCLRVDNKLSEALNAVQKRREPSF